MDELQEPVDAALNAPMLWWMGIPVVCWLAAFVVGCGLYVVLPNGAPSVAGGLISGSAVLALSKYGQTKDPEFIPLLWAWLELKTHYDAGRQQ